MVSPMKKPWSEPVEIVMSKSDEIPLTIRDASEVHTRNRVEPEEEITEERTKSLFEPNDLKKLSVTINTSTKTVNTSDTLIRYITDPDLIKPVRRRDEGKRPIFDRPEILKPINARSRSPKKTSEDRLKELRRNIFSSVDLVKENEVEKRFHKRRKKYDISRSPSMASSRVSRKEPSEDSTTQGENESRSDSTKSQEKRRILKRKFGRNDSSRSHEDRYRSRSRRRNHRSYSPGEVRLSLKLRRREDRRRKSRSGSDRSYSRDGSSGDFSFRGRSKEDSRKFRNIVDRHTKRDKVTSDTSSPETTDDDQLETKFLSALKNVKRLARQRKEKEDRKNFLQQVKKKQSSDKEKIYEAPKEGVLRGTEEAVSTMVIASTSQSVELVRRAPERPSLPYYPHPPFSPHPPPGYIRHRHPPPYPPPHPPPYSPPTPTTTNPYPPPGFYPH